MVSTANSLLNAGILQQKTAPVSGFTYDSVDNNNVTSFHFPAVFADTTAFMVFVSYVSNLDQRGHLIAYEDDGSSRGIRVDDVSADGVAEPEIDWVLDATDKFYNGSVAAPVIGDLLNLLVTGEISGGSLINRAVLWEETGSVVTTLFDADGADAATAFNFSRFSPIVPTLFAAYSGQRHADLICNRFAFWDDGDFTGGVPDIRQASVQDNFFDATTGALVDPATVSHVAYGTPIYDIYGTLAEWNAGTNKGHGGNLSRVGPALT